VAVACAARQTPAPIEYLPRKAGLGQEESMPSSGRLNFMSQLTSRLTDPAPVMPRMQPRRDREGSVEPVCSTYSLDKLTVSPAACKA
jgi:hypothetical protein